MLEFAKNSSIQADNLKGKSKAVETKDSKSNLSNDSQVWNAIGAFERILEAMPTDRVALETLYEAYEQIGQKPRAIEYLIRLCESVIEVRDVTAAPNLIEKLRRLESDDPAMGELADRLATLVAGQPKAGTGHPGAPAENKRKNIDITGELSLAWNLLQAGQFTQDEYSAVVHDLSESSSTNTNTPVTVLHVLHGRSYPKLDKIIAYLAKDSDTPVATLSSFEIQKSTSSILPLEFMETRGAIVFELMGSKDAMVAVLNPYDTGMRDEVRHISQRKCHFYQVDSDDYDRALGDIRKSLLAVAED